MGDVTRVEVGGEGQTAEETAAALSEAAKNAPTTAEEAQAKIDAEKAASAGTQRPAHIPEKFWDAEKGEVRLEDLAKSYAELEKAQSKPQETPEGTAEETSEEKPKGKSKAEGEDGEGDTDDDAPKGAEVIDRINANWAENGELSDEDYELAQKTFGVDKAFVDKYIADQVALADAATRRINEAGGGEEGIQRMYAWAGTSLDQKEIDAFNAVMEGADVNAAVVAMEGLKAKYEVANGKDPKLVSGKTTATEDVYGSWAEVTRDMGTEEYRKDAAFRAKVEAKLSRSDTIRR